MKNFTLLVLCTILLTTVRLVAQPTTAPTTPPARNAGDVISLFSGAYTDIAGTLWFPNWGQTTVVTDEVIAGNNVKKYATLNYQGVQFQDPIVPVNAASMTHLHLDIWTPNCTAFDVFLINTTPATIEHAYTITPTLSGWNSIDIPLTAFTSSAPVIALNNIGQFKLVGTPFGSSTVWLDNIYFWKPANVPTITGFSVPAKVVGNPPFTLTAPTSNSSGAFSYTSSNMAVATISGSTVTIVGAGTSTITANQAAAGAFTTGSTTATLVVTSPGPATAAPTPTTLAANVTSLYSNAYTNVGIDTWSAVWDQADVEDVTIAGNATKKYTNHLYSGIEFTGPNLIDATSKTHFHMDIWTADAAGAEGFKVKLVDFGANGTFDGGDDAASIELPFTPTASGWFAIDVPLSSFTGLTTKAHLAQMVLVTPGGGKTFWMDNVYLYNLPAVVGPAVAAPTPTRLAANVISMFSNAYTDLAGTNWNPGWGQTTVYSEVMIAGNATKKYENLNYQGAEPAAPIDATSKTHVHVDVWTPTTSNFRVKLVDFGAGGVFGGGDDTEHELEFTPTGGAWQSLDIPLANFTGMTARAHVAQFIISSTTSPSPTVWLDNIYFYNEPATEPLVAAPTPTRPAANVISLFSNAYTDVAGTDWFPNWGQSTVVTDIMVAGNATKKYATMNYQGVQFATPINASSMINLHVDIWTPNCTAFDVFLINTTPSAVEQKVTLTPTLSGWNSFDILLSQYNTINLTNIGQIKLVATPFGSSTVFLDNIYFWTTATPPTITNFTVPAKMVGDAAFTLTAPTSNSPGAFTYASSNTSVATISGSTVTIVGGGTSIITATQAAGGGFASGSISANLVVSFAVPLTAAPVPTKLAANVMSLFSNTYTDLAGTDWFPNWGQSTVVTDIMIAGNATKKYDNLNYQGVVFTPVVNASTMNFLHVDIWTPNCTAFDVFLINTTPAAVEQSVTLTPTLAGWNSFDIPLTSYTAIALNNIGQFKLVGTPFGSSVVYLDNIFFWKNAAANVPLVAAPTPTRPAANVISLFSNAYTDVAGTDWFPNWGQSTVVTDIMVAGNATKKYETMNYQGVQFATPINASSMLNLHIDLWTPNCTAFDVFLINTSPSTVEQKVTLTPTLSGWNSFDILLSQYNTINLTNIGQIKLVALPSGTSTVYLDNIYFWTTSTPPTITNFTVPAKMVGDAAFTLTAPTSNSPGAFTYASSNTSVATISGTTVTIVGGGTSIITATQAAGGGYASGSISANLVVSFAVPLTAAPTPTRPTANVISLFSNAYTDVAGTDWFPNWGQSTVVTDIMVAGNATKKYETMNYQGVQFATPINASSMLNLHIDLWTPNCTAFDVFLINTSPSTVEQKVTLTPTLAGWNSFDILLSQYNTINLTNIGQIKLVATPFGSSTVYLDNIYFWTTSTPPTITNFTVPAKMVGDAAFTLTAPTSNSPVAFTYASSNTSVATISGTTVTIIGVGTSIITATQAAGGGYASGSISANLVVSFPPPLTAAAAPTKLAANVISLFSDTYTNLGGTDWFPFWAQTTVVSDIMIEANTTKKYDNLNYQGVIFTPVVNASTMNFLHIDLWTPNCTAFDVFLINTTPASVEQSVTLTPTLSGWNSFDIPLTSYTTIALNNIGQFKLVGTPFGSSVVYLDNIFFWRTPSIPVELTSFKAKVVNTTTVLNWQTASEKDNQGFTIERSSNGTSYTAIGQVKGNGTTAIVHDYTFTDNTPSVGNNYYRLRQTDLNGKETLSSVVSVVFGKGGLIVKNTLVHSTLDVTVGADSPTPLSIYNLSGQQVYAGKAQGSQSIDVSAFAAGLYIIRTGTGEVSRFVKQ